jgi:hypothetical protein
MAPVPVNGGRERARKRSSAGTSAQVQAGAKKPAGMIAAGFL